MPMFRRRTPSRVQPSNQSARKINPFKGPALATKQSAMDKDTEQRKIADEITKISRSGSSGPTPMPIFGGTPPSLSPEQIQKNKTEYDAKEALNSGGGSTDLRGAMAAQQAAMRQAAMDKATAGSMAAEQQAAMDKATASGAGLQGALATQQAMNTRAPIVGSTTQPFKKGGVVRKVRGGGIAKRGIGKGRMC